MNILEVNNISKAFGGLKAVNKATFTVGEGNIKGLIGPNGAGKTTLFNVIAGYYKPDEGSVLFEGKEIHDLPPYKVCALGLARTFQTTKPFMESTVLDNIVVGALVQNKNVGKAKRIAFDIIDRLGLQEIADSYGHEITVPDRKILEIARAMATGGRLLLLDEPLAGLNPSEKVQTVEMIRKINADGISIIIVEHDMKSIMSLCSRIVLLNRGEVLVEGTPQEVTADPKAIAAYLGDDYAAA